MSSRENTPHVNFVNKSFQEATPSIPIKIASLLIEPSDMQFKFSVLLPYKEVTPVIIFLRGIFFFFASSSDFLRKSPLFWWGQTHIILFSNSGLKNIQFPQNYFNFFSWFSEPKSRGLTELSSLSLLKWQGLKFSQDVTPGYFVKSISRR